MFVTSELYNVFGKKYVAIKKSKVDLSCLHWNALIVTVGNLQQQETQQLAQVIFLYFGKMGLPGLIKENNLKFFCLWMYITQP